MILLKINKEKCIGCENCIDYCPMNAIFPDDGIVSIDLDNCLECSVCLRSKCCPADAIYREELVYPRDIAHFFSDPFATHPSTSIPGRGTEEMKTNEVTNRFPPGIAGIAIELGRPGIGTRFEDVEKVLNALKGFDLKFERENPVTALIQPDGTFPEDLRNTKVMSAIVEFGAELELVPAILNELAKIEDDLQTVFSLDLAVRCDDNGVPILKGIDKKIPYNLSINGKTNIGIGRSKKDRGGQ